MTQKPNKAHTATLNRIAQRYGTGSASDGPFAVQTGELTIVVETTATIDAGMKNLVHQRGKVYIAVTNKEAISVALQLTSGTRVGVMDPQGNIVRESKTQ